jgi:hypothetical protein
MYTSLQHLINIKASKKYQSIEKSNEKSTDRSMYPNASTPSMNAPTPSKLN